MSKIGFCSDIHFDHASEDARQKFYDEVKAAGTEYLLVGGDIGSAVNEAEAYIKDIEENTGVKRVFWVRGNHDFWGSGIKRLREVTKHYGYLTNEVFPWLIGDKTLLVGHDGWYDASVGSPLTSRVEMNDWAHIAEFKGKTRSEIISVSREFACEAQVHFERLLGKEHFFGVNHVIILTHVPPFQEVHLDPRGNPGNNDWAPWFVNANLGEYLLQKAAKHPSIQFDVYCGHTHGACEAVMAPNLRVVVAGADYKHPRLWGLI